MKSRLITSSITSIALIAPLCAQASPRWSHWCNDGMSTIDLPSGARCKNDNLSPAPVRAAGLIVTYTLDPRIPHKKSIIKEIEKYNDQLQGYLQFKFTGYEKIQKPDANYHLRLWRQSDWSSSSIAFLRYLSVDVEPEAARIKSAVIVLNRRAIRRISGKSRRKRRRLFVAAAVHELIGHGSGLGHNDNPESLMHSPFSGAERLTTADIQAIKGAYTSR